MKLVIFGLTISSSWGNGHATLWRGLCRALAARGHHVVFFERDVPYYAAHRDFRDLPGGRLVFYADWLDIQSRARQELADADAAVVTSYCPDGIAAGHLVQESARPRRVFYDLDTPVTLSRLAAGERLGYLDPKGLAGFDLVLSFAGGRALAELATRLGARRVLPLYGSVDPAVHRPTPPVPAFVAGLSYLGTYAADRQAALARLFVDPARRLPAARFVIGGAQYPEDFPWTDNIFFVRHLPPQDHPAFFCSSRLTLNVTRAAMAAMGYCPSGRLFEAAACGTPIVSDTWEGLPQFFTPGVEIITATSGDDVIAAMSLGDRELSDIADAARERVLREHSADRRAGELEAMLWDSAAASRPAIAATAAAVG